MLVRLDDVVSQPWRNGGGRTRELLTRPDASSWQVRVSVAEVDVDGPFSAFAGVQRWFAVLEGDGVELTIDGRCERVTPASPPLCFPGAAACACRLLGGPTLDLNLMLRGAVGGMHGAVAGIEWRPRLAQCGLFTRVAGRCLADGAEAEVPAHALLWFGHAPARLSFVPERGGSAVPGGCWLEAGSEEIR
jgi:environmental stress-induced protein Ves